MTAQVLSEALGVSIKQLGNEHGHLEIRTETQTLDEYFVDSWIDTIERFSEMFNFRKVSTITLVGCKFYRPIAYDIFCDFVNILELRLLFCELDSKNLTDVLTFVNPYSLSRLDLTGSTFSSFAKDDFRRITSLFSLSSLILPANMDEHYKTTLEKLFAYPTMIVSDDTDAKAE